MRMIRQLPPAINDSAPVRDIVQGFLLEKLALRGRFVRLDQTLTKILSCHPYPQAVAQLLAEALAVSALLMGMLKFDGIFTLQLRGSGAVPMLVADITNTGGLRGYARWDTEKLIDKPDYKDLVGEGYLALTVDQFLDNERYQGVVDIQGDSLADAVRYYFQQSEQVRTAISVYAHQLPNGTWQAGAMMLQPMAQGEANLSTELAANPDSEDDWQRAMLLMSTIKPHEMCAGQITPEELLYRLFHEDDVVAYPPMAVQPQCRCSVARMVEVLETIDMAERQEFALDSGSHKGQLSMTCEFCNTSYYFDPTTLEVHDA
jgi:molecular chaperone Hsp33